MICGYATAITTGIPLTQQASARRASINGPLPSAFRARSGRYIQSGIALSKTEDLQFLQTRMRLDRN